MDINKINELYLKEDYKGLSEYIEGYKQSDPGSYWYNKGLIHYKTGELSKARLFWERAQGQGAASHELHQNLKVVKSELGVTSLERENYHHYIINYGQSSLFLTFILILAIISLASAWRKLWSVSLSFLIVLSLSVLGRFTYINQFNYLISLKEQPIREGPSKIFKENNMLPAGVKVLIEKKQDNWALVVSPEDLTGWVDLTSLEEI